MSISPVHILHATILYEIVLHSFVIFWRKQIGANVDEIDN